MNNPRFRHTIQAVILTNAAFFIALLLSTGSIGLGHVAGAVVADVLVLTFSDVTP